MERIKAADLTTLKPAKRARVDREGPVHIACLNWLRGSLPGALVHHSPNEMSITADRISKAIAQSKSKKLGMVPGFPDLLVLWQGHAWFIEVKAPGGRLTEKQQAVGLDIAANGHRFGVVWSLEDCQALVREWRKDVVVRAPMKGSVT